MLESHLERASRLWWRSKLALSLVWKGVGIRYHLVYETTVPSRALYGVNALKSATSFEMAGTTDVREAAEPSIVLLSALQEKKIVIICLQ